MCELQLWMVRCKMDLLDGLFGLSAGGRDVEGAHHLCGAD